MRKGTDHDLETLRAPARQPSPADGESLLYPADEDVAAGTPTGVDSDTVDTLRPGTFRRIPTGDPEITFRQPRLARGSRPPTGRLPLQAPKEEQVDAPPSGRFETTPPTDVTSQLALQPLPAHPWRLIAVLSGAILLVTAAIVVVLLA